MITEKLQAKLLLRLRDIEVAMFQNPPKSMEDFRERWGRQQELLAVLDEIKDDALGIEEDDK